MELCSYRICKPALIRYFPKINDQDQFIMKCPACNKSSLRLLETVPFRDFDGSVFNCDGKFYFCDHCEMIRVITGMTDREITAHYANESLYFSQSGVGVGGSSKEDLVRYAYYLSFIKENDISVEYIADVGCSRGGFLRYLSSIEPNATVIGVDCDHRSLESLRCAGFEARTGDVFDLPLSSSSLDTLTYFHVLEHIYDVERLLAEANRVLNANGGLVIEVPDFTRYFDPKTYVGPMFWLAMKEHVNHFCLTSIAVILARSGFQIQSFSHSNQLMKGNQHYPSLLVYAKKERVVTEPGIRREQKISDFPLSFGRDTQRMQAIAEKIRVKVGSGPIVFWGIGLEFFALYGYLAPLLSNSFSLIDSNSAKTGLTVDGNAVSSFSEINIDGTVLVCSYMVASEIKDQACSHGWPLESVKTVLDFF